MPKFLQFARFFFVLLTLRVHGFTTFRSPINPDRKLFCSFASEVAAPVCDSITIANNALLEKTSLVTFFYPSGLLITESNEVSYCLLQHNIVSLRPACKRVLELEGALSKSMCAKIIEEAEVYAANNGGWTVDRHTSYPTTDLPLEDIFGRFSQTHGLVNGDILPHMASFFNLNEEYLSIGELFVAKYEFGNRQAGLGECLSLLEMQLFDTHS